MSRLFCLMSTIIYVVVLTTRVSALPFAPLPKNARECSPLKAQNTRLVVRNQIVSIAKLCTDVASGLISPTDAVSDPRHPEQRESAGPLLQQLLAVVPTARSQRLRAVSAAPALAAPRSPASEPSPLADDAVIARIQTDLDSVAKGSPPKCSDGTEPTCPSFYNALKVAVNRPPLLGPIPIFTPAALTFGKDIAQATVSYSVTPALDATGFTAKVVANVGLTLFGKFRYQVADFESDLAAPTTGESVAKITLGVVPNGFANSQLQNVSTTLEGPALAGKQNGAFQKLDNFCPDAVFSATKHDLHINYIGPLSFSGKLTCTATVYFNYLLNANPLQADADAEPFVAIHVNGALTGSVPGASATIDGDIDVVTFQGHVGAIYRTFRDTYVATSPPVVALVKPYLYYDLSALDGSFTLSADLLFGAYRPKPITIFAWKGIAPQERRLDISDASWIIVPIASIQTANPTPAPLAPQSPAP